MDGVEQPNQNQQESAEERLAAQAKEIQDLREQLARVAVKEGPRLPPLSVPEVNRALEKPQLAQWMRLMLSNIKAYVRLPPLLWDRMSSVMPQLLSLRATW